MAHIFGQVTSEDVPDEADAVELFFELNLESVEAGLTVEQTASFKHLLILTRQIGKSLAQCHFSVTIVLCNEVFSSFFK